VCGSGTFLDGAKQCQVDAAALAGNGVVYNSTSGKVEIACPPSDRRLEEGAQEGAPEPAVEAIVDGFLAQNPAYLAKLQHTQLDGETAKLMKDLLQLFGRPALAQDERASA